MADESVPQSHHKQEEVCFNRPGYREGRWEKAVKVYTVNQESRYVLVLNVPALGVTKELMELSSLYGSIEEYRILDEYPSEPYTDVFFLKYSDISTARVAKNKLDNRTFFSNKLHVCYAPEYETVQDTRDKLAQRRRLIASKTKDTYEKAMAAKAEERRRETNPQLVAIVAPLHSVETPSHSAAETSEQSSVTISVPGLPPLPPYPPPPHITHHPHPSTTTITTPIISTPTHSRPSVTGLSTQDRIALHLQHSEAPTVQHRDPSTSRYSQPAGGKGKSRTKKTERVTSSHNPAPSTSSLSKEDTITGDSSLDATVAAVRSKITEVMSTSNVVPLKPKPRKRKRI